MENRWQPIETAPRDGSRFLIAWSKNPRVSIVWWHDNYRSFTTGTRDRFGIPDQYGAGWFTHWMALPNLPPQGIEARSGETREAGLDGDSHESPVGVADAP